MRQNEMTGEVGGERHTQVDEDSDALPFKI